MFEAHLTKAEDFQGPETVVYSWTKTYYRRHKLSFQPLKIWFASGQRKIKSGGMEHKIFVYIEYQNEQAKNQYCCLEVTAGLSVIEALDLATKADLN